MVFDTEFANDKSAILSQGITVVILFALGMVGNGILMVAYCRDHRMQTPTNMLVISHISAEFLFSVNGILVYGSSLIRLEVLEGNLCILAGTINMFLFFVSVLSLTAIAVDRYFAVVRKSHHKFTKNLVRRVVVVIWSQAVVSAIPWDLILINKPGKRFIAWVLGNCEKYLTLREHNNVPVISFRIVLWILSFMIPCVVIFYASGQILRTALNKRVRVHVLEYPRNPVDAYSKSSFTTIMITTVYFLCLIPSLVLYILREGSSGSYYSPAVHIIAKVAMSFRSVCYPVIFIARNRKFSGHVRTFLRKKCTLIQRTCAAMHCRSLNCRQGVRHVYECPTHTGRNSIHFGMNGQASELQVTPSMGMPVRIAFTDLKGISENSL